jgi:transposase
MLAIFWRMTAYQAQSWVVSDPGEKAMEAYSMDLRLRVMADVDADMRTNDVAKKYSVSPGWIRKLKRFRRDSGSFAPRTQRVSHATKLDSELPRLEKLVQEQPDATLQELRLALGVQVGLATVWRALKRLQITFKKK